MGAREQEGMSMLEGKLGMIAGVAAAAAGVVGIGAAALWLTEEEDEETEQDTVNDGSKSPRKDAAAAAAPRDSKIFAIIDPVERAMKQILSAAEFAKFKALPQPESLAGIQAWEAQLQPFIQDEARQQAFVAAYEREQALRQIFDAQLAVKKEIAGEYKKYLTEENCKVFDAKMAAIETDGPTPEATWFDGLDDWLVENVTDFEASWSAVTDANAHALFAKKGEEFKAKFEGERRQSTVAQLIQQQTMQFLKQYNPQAAQQYAQIMQLIMSGQVPAEQNNEIQQLLAKTVHDALPPQVYVQLQVMVEGMETKVDEAKVNNMKQVYGELMERFSLRAVLSKEDTLRLRTAERNHKSAAAEGKANAELCKTKLLDELKATYHTEMVAKMDSYEAITGHKVEVADPTLDQLKAIKAKKEVFEKELSMVHKFIKGIKLQQETLLTSLDGADKTTRTEPATELYNELLADLVDGGSLEESLKAVLKDLEAALSDEPAAETVDEPAAEEDEEEEAAADEEEEAAADESAEEQEVEVVEEQEVETEEAVEEVPEVSRADSDDLFDKFDADDSGGLDLDELLEMIAEVKHADKAELQTEEIKKAWDADGDGSVTKYEFHQRLIRMREAKPELFEQFLRAMLEVTAEDLMEM